MVFKSFLDFWLRQILVSGRGGVKRVLQIAPSFVVSFFGEVSTIGLDTPVWDYWWMFLGFL